MKGFGIFIIEMIDYDIKTVKEGKELFLNHSEETQWTLLDLE